MTRPNRGRLAFSALLLAAPASCDKPKAGSADKAKAVGGAAGALIQKAQVDAKIDVETDAVDAKVTSPRDAASGLPTGKRQHKPISF